MTGLLKYINFNITTLFYDYLNPLVVIQSISLYIFMIKFTAEIKFTAQLKNTILLLSSLTFGIYIIHPIFIDLVIKNNENLLLHKNAFIVVPLFSIMVFFLSGIVTYIFLKIPF
jgi:surface polysaccharide O-acyltransferase-like enzyme